MNNMILKNILLMIIIYIYDCFYIYDIIFTNMASIVIFMMLGVTHMRFKYKLVLSVVVLGSILLLIGGFSYYTIMKSSTTKQILQIDKENSDFISESIEEQLLDLVRSTKILASTNVIKDSLITSNEEFFSMDINDRIDYIDDLNNQWINIDDIDDPFISSRMENDSALFLISQQNDYPELYGEIFLTNEYGVMISTTGKLSTLAHAEKYWWIESYNDGDGIVYIDDRGFDTSVNGYVLGIVVPVYDDFDNIIGIIKCNYNIASIFEKSVSNFHDLSGDGQMYIVRTLGLIINGEDIEPLSESVSEDILPYVEERIDISKEIIIDEENSFLTISPIDLTFDSDQISFGGKYESIDHSLGNLGEGWSVVHIYNKQVALGELTDTMLILSTVSFGLLLVISVSALIIGQSLSKPFVKLNNYISDVSDGNLVKRDIKISNDEIGELTTSFNNMIGKLSNTLISKEKLEKEKNLAQKYLFDLKATGNIFENSISNAPLPIMIHSEDGTVLNLSKTWIKLTGYQKSDIPTIYDWTEKAYGQNKAEVIDFIKKMYKLTTIQHDEEFVVTTKDGRKLTWDFNSGYIGNLPDGKAVAMSVATDVTERLAREQEINYISYHDQLTGLYNRRFFEEQLQRLDNPRNLPISIIMGDVNGLKLVNDAFGHQAGDKLLKTIGNIISESIRGNDIATRWGGDEFTIVLPNSDSDAAEVLVKRIQDQIKDATFEFGNLSISFGIDTKIDKENINDVFLSSEKLMYQNKLTEIDSARGETINTIMTTLFEKSPEVKEHSNRVSELAFAIAEKMELSKSNANDIKVMGLIHDIGKIVIDLHILDKPGKLTEEERKIIEQHPLSGSRMLNSSHEYSRLAAGVLHHHERIDGKGYPNGIKGNQIPIESKIIAVADAYDAMTAVRPYRLNPLTMNEAISELQKHSGTQFDKSVVDVFVNKVLLKNIE